MPDDPTPTDPPSDDDVDDDPPSSDDDPDIAAIRDDPTTALRTITALKSEAADYRRRARKLEQDLEELKTSALSDAERAIAEAERRGRDTALAEHGRKLLEAQVLAAAAGKLRDPADAVRYLDLDELLELEERDRDIDKRIDTLLADKEYLAVAKNGDEPVRGVRSQGARTQTGGAKSSDVDGDSWLRKTARRT